MKTFRQPSREANTIDDARANQRRERKTLTRWTGRLGNLDNLISCPEEDKA